VALALDSGLDQDVALSYHGRYQALTHPPDVTPKAFRLEGLVRGEWQPLVHVTDNHQRFVRCAVGRPLEGVRFCLENTWGAAESRVYAFTVEG